MRDINATPLWWYNMFFFCHRILMTACNLISSSRIKYQVVRMLPSSLSICFIYMYMGGKVAATLPPIWRVIPKQHTLEKPHEIYTWKPKCLKISPVFIKTSICILAQSIVRNVLDEITSFHLSKAIIFKINRTTRIIRPPLRNLLFLSHWTSIPDEGYNFHSIGVNLRIYLSFNRCQFKESINLGSSSNIKRA